MIGLNVGSGQRPFTSTPEVKWINIDSVAKWEPDVVCDGAHLVGSQGFTFTDKSVHYVVLHHVLEHFGCGEAQGLIAEAHRALKPGGSLLVFVPNMRALAERWLKGGISTQIYMTNLYGAYMGHEEDRHKWGFDWTHLFEFLTQQHWLSVVTFDGRQIPGADIAQDWWILGMECIK